MKEQITVIDMRTCCSFLKDREFRITARDIGSLNIAGLSPVTRAVLYGVLAFTRGAIGQALSFMKVGKELAFNDEFNDEERIFLLHIEGILLSMAGDGQGAIERQRECLDGCQLLDDAKMTAEVLSHLSFLYQVRGEKELAKKCEKKAARLLLKKTPPRDIARRRRPTEEKGPFH